MHTIFLKKINNLVALKEQKLARACEAASRVWVHARPKMDCIGIVYEACKNA
jgi:hypothetical protein